MVVKILLHSSGVKEQNKVAMEQYLSKYLFEKYEDETTFVDYKYGLPVSTSINPESVSAIVDDANMTLTSLRIL